MPAPETLADRYELRGLLGRGGMGDVYDGWDRRLGRPVAIKVLRPDLAAATDIRQRFESEARTAATINHPNVVAVHDSGEDAGRPFIVMERLPGRTLADELAAGPLPAPRVRVVLADVLAALDAAHSAGILHRDIKPGNVLFTSSGALKVTDFGIAKTAESTQTATGEVLGTVAYLSPDRISGRPATVTDDLYAVGVVGYEALAGHRPFAGDNILSVARSILDQQAPRLGTDADPVLVDAIERAMSSDPGARFPSADAMRRALVAPVFSPAVSAAAVNPPPLATRVVTSSAQAPFVAASAPAPRGRPRRPMLVLGLIAAVVTAVVAGVLVLALGSDNADAPATTPQDPGTSAITTTSELAPLVTAPVDTTPTDGAPAPVAPLPTDGGVTGSDDGARGDKDNKKDNDKPGNGDGNGNSGNGNGNNR
jgi:serine/threonine-protein kinase